MSPRLGDIAWFTPTGEHMGEEHWRNGYARSLMVFLNGEAIPEPDPRGQRVIDDSFLILFNGHDERMSFTLPPAEYGQSWLVVFDTAEHHAGGDEFPCDDEVVCSSRSTVVLTRQRNSTGTAGELRGRGVGAHARPRAGGDHHGGRERGGGGRGGGGRGGGGRPGVSEPHRAPSHRPAAGRPVPTSTYRLQVSGEQTFADVGAAAEYLAALGVTHAYLSPVLAATPGSTHGYDVLDHTRLSADAGGRQGFDAMVQRLHAAGVRVVADVVPNHMTVPVPVRLNAPLWAVLREGPSSPFASWFDIDSGCDSFHLPGRRPRRRGRALDPDAGARLPDRPGAGGG